MPDILSCFYQDRAFRDDLPSCLDSTIMEYINSGELVDRQFDDLVDARIYCEDMSPFEYVNQVREILTLNILTINEPPTSMRRKTIKSLVRKVSSFPLWEEFQLATAMIAINKHLVGIDYNNIEPVQLSSGAAPMEYGGHWLWANIPMVRYHAELGALWALLGKVSRNESLLLAAERLAVWQLNVLDSDFYPFGNLFTQEPEGGMNDSVLHMSYLLFHTVAVLCKNPKMEYVARQQLRHLHNEGSKLSTYPFMLSGWLDQMAPESTPVFTELHNIVCDAGVGLMGKRTANFSVITTFSGGNTGLGTLRFHDIGIANYGPQLVPLGECEAFGIEKRCSQKNDILKNFSHEITDDGFIASGKARLALGVNKPTVATFRNNRFSGKWMHCRQQVRERTLYIEASMLGLHKHDEVAFTFYGKAETCSIENQKRMLPKTLDSYKGVSQSVTLDSNAATLTIIPSDTVGEMQVIPLAGEKAFWGADFLIAYFLSPRCRQYSWEVIGN